MKRNTIKHKQYKSFDIEIQKCYFIAIKDKNGNEVDCDYCFCNSQIDAEQIAKSIVDEHFE